jgi:tetratricopeptide (TPR) repeat protein
VPDNPRIEELRRRVQTDPASIAFAQLGEEHRRAGDYEEAIFVCRTGLAQHPGYLSARVTLGRALLETGQYDEAQAELELVLGAAPDNLAAIRALADIHQRREEPRSTPPPLPADLPPAPADLDLAFRGSDDQFAQALETLDALPRELPIRDPGLETRDPFPDLPGSAPDSLAPDLESPVPEPEAQGPDPDLAELEGWLAAIVAAREARQAMKDS